VTEYAIFGHQKKRNLA